MIITTSNSCFDLDYVKMIEFKKGQLEYYPIKVGILNFNKKGFWKIKFPKIWFYYKDNSYFFMELNDISEWYKQNYYSDIEANKDLNFLNEKMEKIYVEYKEKWINTPWKPHVKRDNKGRFTK